MLGKKMERVKEATGGKGANLRSGEGTTTVPIISAHLQR